MYDTPLTTKQILTYLAETPAHLAGITDGMTSAKLKASPEPGEWSARDVLAHLRACSDMWGKYIGIILGEERPTFYSCQSRHLDQENELSRAGISCPAAGFYGPECRAANGAGVSGTRGLVTLCNGDRGWKATQTNRVHLCSMAGKP
jgi:hypothetical protein